MLALGAQADRFAAAGRWEEALRVYHQALEVLPGDPRLLLSVGLARAGSGDHPGAVEAYQRSLLAQPRHALALVNLGTSLAQLGDREGAYRRATEVDPHSPLAFVNLGNGMLRRRDPAAAIDHYRRAVAIGPSLAQVHFYLARAYILTGEYHRAFAAVRHGLKFDTTDPTARQMLVDLEASLEG